MGAVVECTGLTKRFENNVAVADATFDVQRGEVFGLLGPDGAGKTTTIRMLTAVLKPTAGRASVLGLDVIGHAEHVKARIGYMAQRFSIYGDLTVAENIDFSADLFQVPDSERPERVERLLAASRLAPFTKRLAQNLSGGMKQKLALVCTLVHTPEVLFLDEPTTGVDPVSRRDFWAILYGLVGEGMTLFVSTPYMDEAERCHRVALMHRGRILVTDTPAAIRGRMTGTVFEMHVSDSWAARKTLATAPGILSVEAFGERVHVAVDSRDRGASARTALERVGIELTEMRELQPGLEDVFVSLTREEDRAGLRD